MKGSDRFNSEEAERIRKLLVARGQAGRSEQKRLRDELRSIGFHINDWGAAGFTAVEFDALVRSGRITIVESDPAG